MKKCKNTKYKSEKGRPATITTTGRNNVRSSFHQNTCILEQEEKRRKLQHMREDKGEANIPKTNKNNNRGREQGRPFRTEQCGQQAAAPVLSYQERRDYVRSFVLYLFVPFRYGPRYYSYCAEHSHCLIVDRVHTTHPFFSCNSVG